VFINDDEAQVAAEAWVAENEGWEYKGQHLVEGDEKKHSKYEVHKIQAPEAAIENPLLEKKEEENAEKEGEKIEVEEPKEEKVEEEVKQEEVVDHAHPAAGLGVQGSVEVAEEPKAEPHGDLPSDAPLAIVTEPVVKSEDKEEEEKVESEEKEEKEAEKVESVEAEAEKEEVEAEAEAEKEKSVEEEPKEQHEEVEAEGVKDDAVVEEKDGGSHSSGSPKSSPKKEE